MKINLSFYKGKKVFLTGHTGFKGGWLAKLLLNAGAEVTGFALAPETRPNLYELLHLNKEMNSIIGDVRDWEYLWQTFQEVKPEIVFHLAAQPLVLKSYEQPKATYETNVLGTINVLECIKNSNCVRSLINVTSDKVYENQEWVWGYRETDKLNGFDPYSNSKSCSELVTDTYRRAFLEERGIAVSTVRAGNVIGGGDFTEGRIIPDCVSAAMKKERIQVKNPHSVRPYQHVLEALSAYLLIAQRQYEDIFLADSYNVGPRESDCITTKELVELFCKCWHKEVGEVHWQQIHTSQKREANLLKLDCSKLKERLLWEPTWNIEEAVRQVVLWAKNDLARKDCGQYLLEQFHEYNKN